MEDQPEKSKRKKWDRVSMQKAYEAIVNGKMGYLKAAKAFDVPRSTLQNYVKNKSKTIDQLTNTKLGRKTTFTPEIEKELVDYCLQMINSYHGLKASEIRRLAFQLAIKHKIPHRFLTNQGSAGKKWLKLFLARNPCLSFKKPSANAVKASTRQKINSFYDTLEAVLPNIDFDPCRIFNVDETTVAIGQRKRFKVMTLKGKRRVAGLSPAEKNCSITLVTCMNAAGFYVPPLLIFPTAISEDELKNGAPPGSIFACHESGWIQDHIFTEWFKHFIETTKPSVKKPVILIFCGHFSHTRNINVIDLARQNGVVLISIPPRTSNRMQPIEIGFMNSFKVSYGDEIEAWLKNHPGEVVTAQRISELTGKAYVQSANLENSVIGFQKTGIFPINRDLLQEFDFDTGNEESEDDGEVSVDRAESIFGGFCREEVFIKEENRDSDGDDGSVDNEDFRTEDEVSIVRQRKKSEAEFILPTIGPGISTIGVGSAKVQPTNNMKRKSLNPTAYYENEIFNLRATIEVLHKRVKVEQDKNNDLQKQIRELTHSNLKLQNEVSADIKLIAAAVKKQMNRNAELDVKSLNFPPIGYENLETQQVHLGNNIWLSRNTFNFIFGGTKPKTVIRDLCRAVFPTEVLVRSTVTGRPTNKNRKKKGNADEMYPQELDPTKVEAIRDTFVHYLKTKHPTMDQKVKDVLIGKVRTVISCLIADTKKEYAKTRKDNSYENVNDNYYGEHSEFNYENQNEFIKFENVQLPESNVEIFESEEQQMGCVSGVKSEMTDDDDDIQVLGDD